MDVSMGYKMHSDEESEKEDRLQRVSPGRNTQHIVGSRHCLFRALSTGNKINYALISDQEEREKGCHEGDAIAIRCVSVCIQTGTSLMPR